MVAVNNNIRKDNSPFSEVGLQQETIIVIPCYNEEKRLDRQAFLDYANKKSSIGFLFVNDGSQDGTLGVLISLRQHNPIQIAAISLAKNSGKAEAVRAGLIHAIRSGAKKVGYWDADLATPLEAINDFSTILNRYDDVELVYGARRMLMGHRIYRTWDRRIVSRICATLARFAISLPVSDTQCGAKLFKVNKRLEDAIAKPFKTGWLFDVELFSRLANSMPSPRKAFYEQPLSEWEEIADSKITTKAIIKAGFSILGLIIRNRVSDFGIFSSQTPMVDEEPVLARYDTPENAAKSQSDTSKKVETLSVSDPVEKVAA